MLEKEIYYLYEVSTNDQSWSNLVFASNVFYLRSKNFINKRHAIVGDSDAATLKTNRDKNQSFYKILQNLNLAC